jgi:hypothetical protein
MVSDIRSSEDLEAADACQLFRRWGGVISWMAPLVAQPFGSAQTADWPCSLLMDVGCRNGDKLRQRAKA